MAPHAVPARASGGAEALGAVAGDVCIHPLAPWGGAAAEPVHATPREVKCRAHRDEGRQDDGEGLVVRAVVNVPHAVLVVGQSWRRDVSGKEAVESIRALACGGGVHDAHPLVEEGIDAPQDLCRRRTLEDDPCLAAAPVELGGRRGPVVGQILGQQDRFLPVRVDMHKTITPLWAGD